MKPLQPRKGNRPDAAAEGIMSGAPRCEVCRAVEGVERSELLDAALCETCSAGAQSLDGWLQRAESFLRRFVVLSDHQACAVALWAAHSYAIEAAVVTPYLWITSPEKRSGKTRLLEVLRLIVAKPWLTGGTTKAALVRKVDRDQPTLLLDESDAAFNGDQEYSEALRGVLNNGFSRGKPYTTCVGNSHEVKDFDVFGAKAIAGIGKLPDTVRDRSIPIGLKRRTRSEKVERFRERKVRPVGETIGAGLAGALEPLVEELGHAEPELPGELSDRAWDIWEPLLALAEAAGGDWPKAARNAAKQLSGDQEPDEDTLGVRLLADIRTAFKDAEKMWTKDLLDGLNALEEAPWGGWNKGEGMRPRELANRLRPYEIRSRSVRIGEATHKGYFREQFVEAWTRYPTKQEAEEAAVPTHIGVPSGTPGTTALASQKPGVSQAAHGLGVPDKEGASNQHSNADVPDVPDSSPESTETGCEDGHHHLTEAEYAERFRARQLTAITPDREDAGR